MKKAELRQAVGAEKQDEAYQISQEISAWRYPAIDQAINEYLAAHTDEDDEDDEVLNAIKEQAWSIAHYGGDAAEGLKIALGMEVNKWVCDMCQESEEIIEECEDCDDNFDNFFEEENEKIDNHIRHRLAVK